MARICYAPKKFTPEHADIIAKANDICEGYAQQGLVLTLRQVYYQFVARGFLPNRQNEYKRLGTILGDARMAGELDWAYLIDRTRNLVRPRWWESPASMTKIGADNYATDLWATQHERIEVWIEKDAGIGVIEGVCDTNQVPYFSSRGYTSMSEIWEGAQRIRYHIENGDRVTILHIGDHDPSGLDMSRDIETRLREFVDKDWLMSWGRGMPRPVTRGDLKHSMQEHMKAHGNDWLTDEAPWRLKRIALNYDQVEQYNPPPNPAKQSDARYQRYVDETGLDESWELDALDPVVLQGLIQDEIDSLRDGGLWAEAERTQDQDKAMMQSLAARWDEVTEYLSTHHVAPQNGAQGSEDGNDDEAD